MLFTLMLLCAIVAIVVIGMASFSEIREVWSHPERHDDSHYHSRLPGTRP